MISARAARRKAVRTLIGATALLTLSGCSLPGLHNVGMGVGNFDTTWIVGSCHRLDQPEQVDPMFPSDTSPAVPCDSPHESETYAVVPLTGQVAEQPERPSPLWLEHALTGACSWSAMTAYLGARPIDALRGVGILQILPSEPEWEHGVRKIRCDVLLGPRTSAAVASVSRPLRAILTGPVGDRFRVCRAGDQEVGCDQPHDAELVNAWIKFSMKELVRETARQQTSKVLAFCRPKAAQYLGVPLATRRDVVLYAGLPQDPPNPAKQVGQCWLGDAKKGRAWIGSLRSGDRRLP